MYKDLCCCFYFPVNHSCDPAHGWGLAGCTFSWVKAQQGKSQGIKPRGAQRGAGVCQRAVKSDLERTFYCNIVLCGVETASFWTVMFNLLVTSQQFAGYYMILVFTEQREGTEGLIHGALNSRGGRFLGPPLTCSSLSQQPRSVERLVLSTFSVLCISFGCLEQEMCCLHGNWAYQMVMTK